MYQDKSKNSKKDGQLTIDPKLDDVLRKREKNPSPKLNEANIILSRLKKNKKYASFFS